MSFFKRPDGIWQWDQRIAGMRITLSGEVREKRAAWQIVKRKLAERSQPVSRREASPTEQALASVSSTEIPASLGMVRTKYLIATKRKYRSDANFKAHASRVNAIVDRLGPDRDLYSLTEEDLEPIAAEIGQGPDPKSNRTVNAYVVEAVRPLFNFARINLKFPHTCMVHWKSVIRPHNKPRVRYLKADEMSRLLASLPDRDGHLHQFAWITGFRATEVLSLRWSDIDWEYKLITTRVKGGRHHSVPMTRRLERLISELKVDGHAEFVFTFRSVFNIPSRGMIAGMRYPFSYQYMHKRFQIALNEAGIKNYRFHDHRHTAATMLYLATGNIRLVQSLLGHMWLSSCGRYIHLSIKDVAREMERIDARDLPHAVMAELVEEAGPKLDDPTRVEDLFHEYINLLHDLAELKRQNDELVRAVASAGG